MGKTIHQDQRGLGAIVILLVILVVAAIGGAGYYVMTKNKDKNAAGSSSTVSNKVAEAECKRAIDDNDLCKMASSYDFENGNYIMTITGAQDGQEASWTIVNDKENSHVKLLGFETITYNGDTYTNEGGSGHWVKYPKSETTEVDQSADSVTEDLDFKDEEASWYTKVGKEACGSMTCFHYSYKDPNDATNNAEFWFDDKEYKIRKITSADEESGSYEMLITYGNAKVSPPENFTVSE